MSSLQNSEPRFQLPRASCYVNAQGQPILGLPDNKTLTRPQAAHFQRKKEQSQVLYEQKMMHGLCNRRHIPLYRHVYGALGLAGEEERSQKHFKKVFPEKYSSCTMADRLHTSRSDDRGSPPPETYAAHTVATPRFLSRSQAEARGQKARQLQEEKDTELRKKHFNFWKVEKQKCLALKRAEDDLRREWPHTLPPRCQDSKQGQWSIQSSPTYVYKFS